MLTFGAGYMPKRTFKMYCEVVVIVIGKDALLLFTVITPVSGTLISEDMNEYADVEVVQRALIPVCMSTWLFVDS